MSIKIKARITRELFHRDDYYVLSCYPLETNRDIKLNDDQAYSLFYWWYSLKCYYNKKFPFLFASAPEGASSDEVESSVNAQIRILTGGDITKEKEIYEHDAYRAITELNEKAREIYESNKKLKK